MANIKLKDANLGTAAELVAFCKSIVGKWGYVYATFGQTCTKALRESKAKQYPKYKNNYMNICPKWDGKTVCDCSGMMKAWALDQAKKRSVTLVASMASGGWDASANGAYTYWCTEKGDIKTMPDEPGIAVFMDKHIGLYIGNGEVIEARGSAYGVVKTKKKDRPWTKWGRLNWVTYGTAAVSKTPETTPPKTGTIVEAEDFGVVTGGTVNVRTGPDKGFKIVGVKRKGDTISLLREKDGWWEIEAGKWISGKYVKVN